jgi:REase_DpnII-MboI
VVPVSSITGLLLGDARSLLERALVRRPQTDPAILFTYWMLRRAGDGTEAKQIALAASQRTGAQLDFQTVAVLGFAHESALLGAEVSGTLKQGLERLAGRQPFVDGNPMPFCSDAVGILGVALGTRSLGDKALAAKIAGWLSSFLPGIYELDGTDDSQRHLFRAAEHVIGGSLRLPAVSHGRAADVLVALAAMAVLPHCAGAQAEQEEERALRAILREATIEQPFERAAIRLVTLDYVIRSAPTVVPGRMAAADLVRLLERIPAGLRKWTWETKPRTANAPLRYWHIDNEYHVQNLLWVMLAPIFPDLDDEQYLAKIGHKSPRADLHIPSMKIIIEAKFLRPGNSMQKVIDEISSDTGLYNAMGNDCAGIIPVIWDDASRSHEHDYLRQGLKKLPRIIDAVVVSRPSGWPSDQPQLQLAKAKAKTSRGNK